ncbi:hypothetical protein GWI33_012360 [Rhynchophorus ferrugineus]|uniref:Uncharacterized protein n=1 Tax=Rhynchophorus ferrugineus TaxID=354439 RepID=A0A834IWB8_RHYFE|nr:hypothetical protein GWI33_012360 [Rhynchophorus ferrugineus]
MEDYRTMGGTLHRIGERRLEQDLSLNHEENIKAKNRAIEDVSEAETHAIFVTEVEYIKEEGECRVWLHIGRE